MAKRTGCLSTIRILAKTGSEVGRTAIQCRLDSLARRFGRIFFISQTMNSSGRVRPLGQDSLDPSWVLNRTGAQGTLERLPHNMVHNNIGGWMPRTLSPRDPIFFMHHCNIDRIWAVWNSLGNDNSAEPLWTDMTFTNNFINTDGSAFSPKVSELFVPESLGYTYGLSAPPATAFASPNLMALRTSLTTLWATPSVNTSKIRTYTVAPAAGE